MASGSPSFRLIRAQAHVLIPPKKHLWIGNFEENNMYSKQFMRTCARVCNYGITTFTTHKNRTRLHTKIGKDSAGYGSRSLRTLCRLRQSSTVCSSVLVLKRRCSAAAAAHKSHLSAVVVLRRGRVIKKKGV